MKRPVVIRSGKKLEKPMTTYNDDKKQALNANDFLGGNYLRKEDVEQPITATVTDVWSEDVMNDGRKKLVVGFREFHKPMVLNKTNIKRFARIFKNGEHAPMARSRNALLR